MMNTKQYKELESYYLDVIKHLFKSTKTFNEFLIDVLTDEELQDEFNIPLDDLKQFIKDISIDDTINTTNKNKLVNHSVGTNYEVLTYNLKPDQKYSTHERVATKYIMNNSKVLSDCSRIIIGGLLSTTKNTRIYLYINN